MRLIPKNTQETLLKEAMILLEKIYNLDLLHVHDEKAATKVDEETQKLMKRFSKYNED